MDLKTATPVEFDTKLAEIYNRHQAAKHVIVSLQDSLHSLAGDRGRQVSRNRKTYKLTGVEATAKTREIAAGDDYAAGQAQHVIKRLDAALADSKAAEAEMDLFDAEYRTRPWSRFFLVTSSAGGHIHSSMACSTCNLHTGYVWMPSNSGQTMAEAIAAWDERGSAEILCTTCFPDAPSARTHLPVDPDQCPGSGTLDYPAETARKGYYSGNYGVCRHCGERITISTTGKMRKHKTASPPSRGAHFPGAPRFPHATSTATNQETDPP